MMRKFISSFLTAMLLLGLTQCHNKSENKLVGVWQLQDLTINGTTLKGNSLGNWLWEFNASGGYLSEIAGMRKKGVYTFKDNMLLLNLDPAKKEPDQSYKVTKLDSVEMELISTDTLNKSSLRFLKRKVSDVSEDKD